MKTTAEVRDRAIIIGPDIQDYLIKKIQGWGDLTDQLRVLGYIAQGIMAFAETELKAIKMRSEMDSRDTTIKVYQQ